MKVCKAASMAVVGMLAMTGAALAGPGITADESATTELKTKGVRKKLFDGKIYTSKSGQELPFVILEPEKTKGKKLPLVICLHDSAAQRRNAKQIDGFALDLASQPSRRRMPCIIVAPVAPDDWTTSPAGEVDGQALPKEAGEAMESLLELVDELIRTQRVDPRRVYIVGREIGGSGALEAAARRPEVFAAVVAVEPHANKDAGKRLEKVAVGIVAESGSPKKGERGSAESGASRVAEELKADGAKKVSLSSGEWSEGGRAAILEWLFRQKK